MVMMRSKYDFITYLTFLATSFMLVTVIYFSTKVSLWENTKKIPIPNIALIFLMILLLICLIYKLIKDSPKFCITPNSIRKYGFFIKSKEIEKNEILEINLFAAGYVRQSLTIVTKIELNNGEAIKLADPVYRNIGELKLALIEFFPEKIKSFKTQKKESLPNLLTDNETIKFSGNPLTNFNTLLFLGFIVLLIAISISPSRVRSLNDMIIAVSLVSVLFFVITGLQMHYFIFSGEYMIVKNHYFPWYKKYYLAKDIIAMNWEHPGKLSQSLRITTKDFKSRYYSAGSLRDKTWEELKEYIKSRGIYFID